MEIISKKGVGPLRFGMTMSRVRETMDSPYDSFMKTPMSEIPTDAFDDLGIHVFYKKPGVCEAIEFAKPSDPIFQGQSLIGRPFNEIRDWFESLNTNVKIEDTGLIAYEIDIGIYAPGVMKKDTALIESVIVFEEGYYD